MQEFLDIALKASRAADTVSMAYYRGDFDVEIKPDQTPVTVADRSAEEAIRTTLLDAFPRHGFYGEESGRVSENAEYLWLVDPIDGTKSFVAGYGMWSTQIALMHRGELVLGVSSAPVMGETAWAASGLGAQLNGEPIRVSQQEQLDAASVSTGNIGSLARSPRWTVLGHILGRANRTRGYGDYYHYHRLAAGQLDAVIESDVNVLDIAALAVIVREAGGVMTDLQGQPVGLATTSVLAAGPGLHGQLLGLFKQ